MIRLVLAVALAAGAAFGLAGPTLALDFEPPVVPPEFLLGAPPAPGTPADAARLRLLSQEDGQLAPAPLAPVVSYANGPMANPPTGGLVPGALPGANGFVSVPLRQGNAERGGCALWNWNSC
ncbi:MAG TPA: hypothetical protein VFB73_01190 [Chloroflexota bacterium]|nr:hypothetical protein [Chloroflexota bacterium]